MNRIIVWSITVALAGFLFGFDTVVISGANEPIKQIWNTSPLFHGTFIMSMALWGTVIGSLFGGIPTKNLGRRYLVFGFCPWLCLGTRPLLVLVISIYWWRWCGYLFCCRSYLYLRNYLKRKSWKAWRTLPILVGIRYSDRFCF